MPKKTISSTQVRLSPKLSLQLDELRARNPYRVSRNAIVEFLLDKAVNQELAAGRSMEGDTGESSFKK